MDFKASKCLEYADLSFNEITKMKNLRELRFLKELNLNNNEIALIEGLKENINLSVSEI